MRARIAALGLTAMLSFLPQRIDAQYGINIDNNICTHGGLDGPCGVNEKELAIARDHGFSAARWTLYWDIINPAPGVYTWEFADAQFKALQEKGFDTYISFNWGPAWATGGKPWYEHFHCMNPDISFSTTPECKDAKASDFNSVAFQEFVREAVKRYGPKGVHTYSFDNERNYRLFWPPDGDITTRMREYMRAVTYPGAQAARETGAALNIPITIVGIEEDNPAVMATMLSLEQELGRVYDVIAIHPYSDNPADPARQLYTIEWALGEAKPYLDGREMWVTEAGRTAYDADRASLLDQADHYRVLLPGLRELGGISRFYAYRLKKSCVSPIHDYGLLLCPGSLDPQTGTLSPATHAPSPAMRVFKEYASRKRAARPERP